MIHSYFCHQVGTGWVLQSKDLQSDPKKVPSVSITTNIIDWTKQVGVLLPLLSLPSPKSSPSSFPFPWSAYLGLLLPLPLTALLLSILSHLSPYQVKSLKRQKPNFESQSKESTLTWGDSLWTLASVLLLNLPETKIKVEAGSEIYFMTKFLCRPHPCARLFLAGASFSSPPCSYSPFHSTSTSSVEVRRGEPSKSSSPPPLPFSPPCPESS